MDTDDRKVPLHVVTTVIDNARAKERELERMRRDADDWREAWERLVEDIGELLHRVKKRPKGRRFVTVLELTQLLTSQGNEKPDA